MPGTDPSFTSSLLKSIVNGPPCSGKEIEFKINFITLSTAAQLMVELGIECIPLALNIYSILRGMVENQFKVKM